MFGMIPFERNDDNFFDLFDNFERKFFGNSSAALPTSAPISATPATALC